jgi:hypothetical protein
MTKVYGESHHRAFEIAKAELVGVIAIGNQPSARAAFV